MADMFNWKIITLGGHVWWDTIASRGGYRLQQNKLTGHARILDDGNVRVAWGDLDAMSRKLDILTKYADNDRSSSYESSRDSGSLDAMEQLRKLKDLLDCGAITQDEFDRKKAELMQKI